MRNVSVVAIVALVGVLGFSAQAQAQGNDLTDVMGWWSSLNCKYMVGAAVHTAADNAAVFSNDGIDGNTPGESRWCKRNFGDLSLTDQAALDTAAKDDTNGFTRKTSADIINAKRWWDSLSALGQDRAVGGLDGQETGDAQGAVTAYTALTVAENARVMSSYEGLLKGATATPEPTPALPLVGLGFLGLLLAGRGVYLRRRRA